MSNGRSDGLTDGSRPNPLRAHPLRTNPLRAVRLGGPVTLGVDGRPCAPDDPLSGLVGGSAEETAEAGSLVEIAQRRADELVAAAVAEAESVRDAAHAIGYREGAAAARGDLADALSLVQQVATQATAIRNDLLRRCEHEMVEMVIAAIGTILGERAQSDRDLASQTVRHALARAGAQNVVRVRLHPTDVESAAASLGAAAGEPPPFELLPDDAIGIGGCVVDTTHGRVDARLDVQLAAIAAMLRDALPPEQQPWETTEDAA